MSIELTEVKTDSRAYSSPEGIDATLAGIGIDLGRLFFDTKINVDSVTLGVRGAVVKYSEMTPDPAQLIAQVYNPNVKKGRYKIGELADSQIYLPTSLVGDGTKSKTCLGTQKAVSALMANAQPLLVHEKEGQVVDRVSAASGVNYQSLIIRATQIPIQEQELLNALTERDDGPVFSSVNIATIPANDMELLETGLRKAYASSVETDAAEARPKKTTEYMLNDRHLGVEPSDLIFSEAQWLHLLAQFKEYGRLPKASNGPSEEFLVSGTDRLNAEIKDARVALGKTALESLSAADPDGFAKKLSEAAGKDEFLAAINEKLDTIEGGTYRALPAFAGSMVLSQIINVRIPQADGQMPILTPNIELDRLYDYLCPKEGTLLAAGSLTGLTAHAFARGNTGGKYIVTRVPSEVYSASSWLRVDTMAQTSFRELVKGLTHGDIKITHRYN